MDVKTELKKNMLRYVELKSQIEILEEEQKELKRQNLEFVKKLGLKKGDYIVFDEISLQIQLIEMIKSKGLDEIGLIEKFGHDKIDYLKSISVKAIQMAIECGKLPEEAKDFILKEDPILYTKVSKI